jgi:hypothetical protein
VFVSWFCGLADGVVVWVSSSSGILSFVNTDELIHGDQHTETKTEESVQSHIGPACKGMCWVGSSRLILSSDITGNVYCWCWWYLGPVPIHYTHCVSPCNYIIRL